MAVSSSATTPTYHPRDTRRWWQSLTRGARLRAIVTTAILLPIGFGWIYPFLWMVSAGFKTTPEIFSGLSLIPADPQPQNFSRAWTDARIGDYFLNTVIVTVGSIAIVLVTISMMGYVLGRYQFPGRT